MSSVYDNIMDALNELKTHAEGEATGVIVRLRTEKEPGTVAPTGDQTAAPPR